MDLCWNEDGQLYLAVGILSAIVAWIFVPIVGLIAVYCGYKLYATEDRKTSGAVIIIAGTVGVLTWMPGVPEGVVQLFPHCYRRLTTSQDPVR